MDQQGSKSEVPNPSMGGSASADADLKDDRQDRPATPEGKPDGDDANTEKRRSTGKKSPDDAPKRGKGEAAKDTDEDATSGDEDADESAGKPRKSLLRRHPLKIIVGLLVLGVAAYAGITWYLNARHYEYTDDAFIDARQFSISPKVAGYVVSVPVTDNQYVEGGALITQIDKRDYENALAQAQAQLKGSQDQIANIDAQISAQDAQIQQAQAQVPQAQAALKFAQEQFDRSQALVKTGSGTVQSAQQNQSGLKGAQSDFVRAQSALTAARRQVDVLKAQRLAAQAQVAGNIAAGDQATLNLGYTTLQAATSGRIARLTGAKGQYVQAGQSIAMFVPDPLWITANFKETQITDMRPGQAVDIAIDAYPARKLHGHVASIQPGSGTAFSLLPAENATGNYVKVTQRVPVKIVFDHVPSDVTLGPGMSIVPSVRVR